MTHAVTVVAPNGISTTTSAITDLVNAAAAAAMQEGVQSGTLVVIRANPSARFFAVFAGVMQAGGTAVVVNPDISTERFRRQIDASPWRAWPRVDADQFCVSDVTRAPRYGRQEEPLLGRSPSYLLATGGSTGAPRLLPGAGLDPASVAAYRLLLRATGWHDKQVQLVCGPLYHAAPLVHAMVGMLSGNELILLEQFGPRTAVEAIEAHRVEWCQLTPHQMQWMSRVRGISTKRLASLRGVLHTAAPCPVEIKRRWLELVTPQRLFEMYSSTEGVGATLVSGSEWLVRPGTVGRGFNTQLRIIGECGETLRPGEVGRVFMRSSRRVFAKELVATGAVQALPNGFLSVGDRGWLDDAGYLYLSGRTVDVANVGGTKVDLHEVETVLQQHPNVVDAAALVVSDDRLGQRVVVWVVLRSGDDGTVILQWCRSRLPRAAIPRNIAVVAELPRSAAGKIERETLLSTRPTP